MWYLDTYTKGVNGFCGHSFELEDLFPEVAEEETMNRELDPLRNFIPVDQLGKSYRDPHMVEFDNSPPIFSSQEEDAEYVKAYDRWIESNAPKADFDLSLGDCDPIVEELEIHTAQTSANLKSMSPNRNFSWHFQILTGRFASKKAWKEDYRINRPRKCKFSYDEETGEFTTWETHYTPDRGRNHRVRGRINPPRRRVDRHEKLSTLFAYERYMRLSDFEYYNNL